MKQIRTTDRKYISWYAVVLIGFTMVWGFPNVINGFALFGGIRAIVPWIAVFLLYMLPYSLMVAVSVQAHQTRNHPLPRAWMPAVVPVPCVPMMAPVARLK